MYKKPRIHAKNFKGKIAEYMIRNSLKYMNEKHGSHFYWHRFYDTSDFQRWVCGKCGNVMLSNLMIQHQPADFWGGLEGRVALLEVKSSMNPKSYNIDYIRPKQIESLTKAHTAGILAYILIVKLGRPTECYMFTLPKLLDLIQNDGRKSIPWDIWKNNCNKELQTLYWRQEGKDKDNKIFDLEPLWKP